MQADPGLIIPSRAEKDVCISHKCVAINSFIQFHPFHVYLYLPSLDFVSNLAKSTPRLITSD